MKLAAGECRANRKRWLSTLGRYRLWSIVPRVVWMSGVYMSRTKCSGTNIGMKRCSEETYIPLLEAGRL